jgi:hypothetical protein
MDKLRLIIVPAIIGAVCGAIVNYTLLPLYIAVDIVRPVPFQGLLPRYMTTEDVVSHGWLMIGYGFFLLGPLLAMFPDRTRVALLIYWLYPWGMLSLGALFLTRPDGLWYRGLIQAGTDLSFGVAHGLVAVSLYRVLQRRSRKRELPDSAGACG